MNCPILVGWFIILRFSFRIFRICQALFCLPFEVLHLFFRGTWITETDRFLKDSSVIGDEIDRTFSGAQDIQSGIGIVAAFQQHRVAVLAGNVIRKTQE